MSDIKEIIEELNTLPKGYISTKTIHGRQYHYRQCLELGKIESYYVHEDELDRVKTALGRRKTLENELKDLLNNGKNQPTLSKRCRELTGTLMMADIPVARFENGQAININNKLCPLMIKRTGNITEFLASRAIDRNRTNSRILKKALGINESEDYIVALHSYGACVTDNYWFKAKGSKLHYADISFENDFYSDIALRGEVLIFPKTPKLTPQLTLTGSYEKCWRRINGKWYLYKQGSDDEIFSELFCSGIAEVLNIPTAKYEYADSCIRTENFADGRNFEPMTSVAEADDSYEHVFNCLLEIDKQLAAEYLRLIWFDSLINNIDRHNENCGLMRDAESGDIISLAPNFDNNLALISRNRTLNMDPSKDGFIAYFKKFLKNNDTAREYYHHMPMPKLSASIINFVLEQIPIKRDEDMISRYIMERYEYLKNL